MRHTTRVATANVKYSLGADEARRALRTVLETGPDLVGLQEWTIARRRLLGDAGVGYHWFAPWFGECVAGVRTDRYRLDGHRVVLLSGPGRAESPSRPLGLEPPRFAAVATARDRVTGRPVSLISFHLVPGVQRRGGDHPQRPRLVARHRRETEALQRVVAERLALGHQVYAVGDSNVHGFALGGLVSAWEGRPTSSGGTLGNRRIDDVHGPGPVDEVLLLTTGSDHRALVATYRAARLSPEE